MATWDGNNFYYSGQGVVLVGDRGADGKPTGLLPIGNVSALTISIATSVLEHKESQTGQRGIDLRLTTETKANLSMTMENFIADNLATALRGTKTVKAGATVAAEAAKVYLGKVTPLKWMKVSAVTIDKGVTPLVPYDAVTAADDGDWDYKINADAGSILWATTPNTSGLVDGDDVTIDYTYAGQNLVDALTVGSVDKFLRFEGLNTADSNAPVIVEVFKFSVDPLRELSLIGDGIGQFQLEGNVLADQLQTAGSKYFRQILAR